MYYPVVPQNRDLPLLSIVVPVGDLMRDYENLYTWISKLNFSILELILVIDNNTQETQLLTRDLRKMLLSDRLIVISGNNSGPGSARNIGMALASSEWIIFWDSDDVPNIDNVLFGINKHSKFNLDAIIGEYEVAFNRGQRELPLESKNLNLDIFDKTALNPGIWRICFRTKSIKDITFPHIYMGEDQVFIAKFFCTPRRIVFDDLVFYKYRSGYKSSLTSSKIHIRDIVTAINELMLMLHSTNQKRFTQIQVVKLITTGMIKGTWPIRVLVSALFFRLIFSLKLVSIGESITIARIIWRNRYVK